MKEFTIPELIEILTDKLKIIYLGQIPILPKTLENLIYQFRREGIIENGTINKPRLYEEIKKDKSAQILLTDLLEQNVLLDTLLVNMKYIRKYKGL